MLRIVGMKNFWRALSGSPGGEQNPTAGPLVGQSVNLDALDWYSTTGQYKSQQAPSSGLVLGNCGDFAPKDSKNHPEGRL